MKLGSCALLASAVLAFGGVARQGAAQSTNFDVQVFLNDFGDSGYFVASFSPPAANVVAATGSGNLNPEIRLQLGKRYKFTYANAGEHPFELIAKGASSFDDAVRLSRGQAASLESDAAVGWLESGIDFYFTVTGNMADLLQPSGKTPGFRCLNHPDQMRGNVVFLPGESPLAWSSGAESFENYPLGQSANLAVTGWAVVDSLVPAEYSAEIAAAPAGNPNQIAGSTRWLRIADAENDAGVTGRTYTNGVVVPGAVTVGKYSFTMRMNVESLGAAGPLIISQHRDAVNAYRNAAGLRVTAAGVEAVILGDAGGNIGKAGADATAPLYAFGDAGGFAQDSWVTVEYEFDYNAGVLNARATGSNGSTVKTAQVAGLSLQAGGNTRDFRLCVRGNGAGNVSTISFDGVEFEGTGSFSAVSDWAYYE